MFGCSVAILALLLPCLITSCTTDRAQADWREQSPRSYPPSVYPDRIILTWAGDPATSQAVTWRTDSTVEQGCAMIAPADPSPDFGDRAIRVQAETTRLEMDGVTACYHSVNFTRLRPNMLYAYRVGSQDTWSEWFQFRTASDRAEPFSFIYLGDAQNAILSMWSRAIRAAYSDVPDARFMVHAGDLVTAGYRDQLWGEWFEAGGWIFAMLPSILTPGNHERHGGEEDASLTPYWNAQFTLPVGRLSGLEEQTYFIDYQGVRVISLNSNEKMEEQAVWLEGVLIRNPNRWTVVTFHHPVFSTFGGRDNRRLRDLWQPLFDRYGVDLALQGHDHAYGRGCDASTDSARRRSGRGTVYVVSISGPKMYDLTRAPWMVRTAENTQLYQVITVTQDTLHYRAMTVTGKMVDAFDLVKQQDGTNLLMETMP